MSFATGGSDRDGGEAPESRTVLERAQATVAAEDTAPRRRLLRAAQAAAVLLLTLTAAVTRGEAPLTTADVVRFLRAGISEHTILTEVQERGFAEALDMARETTLREAGATETLVVALRRAAPAEPAPGSAGADVGVTVDAPAPTMILSPAPVFGASTRTVRIPLAVVDKAGEPVLGLRREDFRISEDGKRRDLTLFSGERRPLQIAVALDLSRSMRSKMLQVEEALRHFIDLLEPADQILVITFNGTVHIAQDLTSDRDLLGKVLDDLEADGSTDLYDAAFEAIKRVKKGPAEGKAVVLVTDGVDTTSAISFEALREYARRAEVPVYSIGLDAGTERDNFVHTGGRPGGGGGRGGFPGGGRGGFGGGGGRGGGGGHRGGAAGGHRAGFDAKPLEVLAEDTGGHAAIVKDLEHYTPGSDTPSGGHLKAAVESIAATLRHRYLLGYEPAQGKPGWRTIRVDVDHPHDAIPQARKGYYAGA